MGIKILTFCILSLLLIGNVSAFFPATREYYIQKQYTEICPIIEKPYFLSKMFPWLFPHKISFECDFREKIKDSEGYGASPDIIRMCYRACWNEELEFSEMQFPLLDRARCLCNEEKSNVQVQVNYLEIITTDEEKSNGS